MKYETVGGQFIALNCSIMEKIMIWPDHETDKDLLGYKHLVDAIFNLAESPHLLPATIGVFGDWGSGKSSLLKMVSSKLGENKNNLVLTFNWYFFCSTKDVKIGLISKWI